MMTRPLSNHDHLKKLTTSLFILDKKVILIKIKNFIQRK